MNDEDDLTHYMDATERMRIRAEQAEASRDIANAAADAAAEAVGAMAAKLSVLLDDNLRLRRALAEVYFHLGPPQPRLTDHAQVPGLVQRALADRDRMREALVRGLIMMGTMNGHAFPANEDAWNAFELALANLVNDGALDD